MGKQSEKNRFVIDKNQPYEYNIAIIILGELCNEGIIDIFDMAKALIKLRKLYTYYPVIDILASISSTNIQKMPSSNTSQILFFNKRLLFDVSIFLFTI